MQADALEELNTNLLALSWRQEDEGADEDQELVPFTRLDGRSKKPAQARDVHQEGNTDASVLHAFANQASDGSDLLILGDDGRGYGALGDVLRLEGLALE
jgi:hypothetical protein